MGVSKGALSLVMGGKEKGKEMNSNKLPHTLCFIHPFLDQLCDQVFPVM